MSEKGATNSEMGLSLEIDYLIEMSESHDPEQGMRRLYSAVILQAMRDLESKLYRAGALYYFRHPHESGFYDHAIIAGMDPDVMLERMRKMELI